MATKQADAPKPVVVDPKPVSMRFWSNALVVDPKSGLVVRLSDIRNSNA